MPLIDVGGLSLWYDIVQGPGADPDATPVLMIQGLGMQASEWPTTLIANLATERQVILVDNRDAGLSQLFGPATDPALTLDDFPSHRPLPKPARYALADMADDMSRLLAAIGVKRTHVVGFSMGGMIAQILAARAAPQVATLTGLMTSAGQAWLASTQAADRMMRRSILFEPDQDKLVAEMLAAEEIYAGRAPLADPELRRAATSQSLARAYRPAGIWRQACAMRAAGDRRALLRNIRSPVLMFHGEDDPVIDLRQASDVKSILPQTDFRELSAIGHILTEGIAEIMTPTIKKFWRKADAFTCH
jgi:pimeloyl-ACP methyl ester carboxylesterase